jgi:hypothetical protein
MHRLLQMGQGGRPTRKEAHNASPAAGVDVVHTTAVASEEAFYTNASGEPLVRYPTADAAGCDPKQLEVKTFDENLRLSNQVAFTVNVP